MNLVLGLFLASQYATMPQSDDAAEVYISPTQRWLENGHILLWLIKDACWAMVWKPGGIFMIAPTLGVAFYILWRSRHVRSELFHNIAVCLWIMANSVWMLSEFLNVEKQYKVYAVYLFLIGITTLVVYYAFFYNKDKQKEREAALALKGNN
jgi:hypothetical protein